MAQSEGIGIRAGLIADDQRGVVVMARNPVSQKSLQARKPSLERVERRCTACTTRPPHRPRELLRGANAPRRARLLRGEWGAGSRWTSTCGITGVHGHQPEPEPTTELQHGSALAVPYRPRLPAGRRGNGHIDRICDALALDALVDEGQSESSLQLDDDGRLAASYRHQIAPDCMPCSSCSRARRGRFRSTRP